MKSSLEKPLSPGCTAVLLSVPGMGVRRHQMSSDLLCPKTASGQNFPPTETGRDEFRLPQTPVASPRYRRKVFSHQHIVPPWFLTVFSHICRSVHAHLPCPRHTVFPGYSVDPVRPCRNCFANHKILNSNLLFFFSSLLPSRPLLEQKLYHLIQINVSEICK